ncbi:UPF0711 protein C18orf21 homolog [Stegastes partitus]|uniref:UPF0711 protein C18orf21 homolog n=1 Tax=Stegastes partitus TaxID=144197 RepID=A0A3B5ACF6_9TELE|nr:PREDICTED: UPF0711 protein C18orf21 homolog [Stegastes partitus]
MEPEPGQESAKFLLNASALYKDKCPALSRFLLQSSLNANAPVKSDFSSLIQNTLICPYCGQWLQPDNHRMRLCPKRRPSARVQSVLLRKARGKRLNLVQRDVLQRFQKSCSVLMATCHACSKTSRHKGMNRDFTSTLAKTHSTPGSVGKYKTPQSAARSNMTTPKTPGKDKTPVHTSRSSTSSSTSGSSSASSKTPSKSKNWVVQRLSKILMREDNQSRKKGGLKDFLSAL